jgi:hypothetical protein
VEQPEVAAELTPGPRGVAGLKFEQAQRLAVHALVDRVGHRQQVSGVVVGHDPRRPHPGAPRDARRDHLLPRQGDLDGVVPRGAEDEVVPEQVDGVGDADLRQPRELVGPDAVPLGDGMDGPGGDLHVLRQLRHRAVPGASRVENIPRARSRLTDTLGVFTA